MTENTVACSHRLLRSYLIMGFFALLGVGEILFVATGVQKLDDVESWLALAGAVLHVLNSYGE